MTPPDRRCLEVVRRYFDEFGYAPSFEELKQELSLSSKSGVHRIVSRLVEQKLLIRTDAATRNLALPDLVDLVPVPTERLQEEIERRRAQHG